VALTGCATAPPPTTEPEKQLPMVIVDPPEFAIELTRMVWQQMHEDNAATPEVVWVEGPCIYSNADHLRGICMGGLYNRPGHIAYVVKTERVSEGALAHELNHGALYLNESNSDTFHDEFPAAWDNVNKINNWLHDHGF
jgi:hypothetical protein